jgi:hypothetical protein
MCSPEGEALLVLIRDDIRRYGQSIVGCDKLLLLVSPNDPIAGQYNHIFLTAMKERWSFEFRTDGTVRFVSLNRHELPTGSLEENPLRKETGA